jgi:hypothetical protein
MPETTEVEPAEEDADPLEEPGEEEAESSSWSETAKSGLGSMGSGLVTLVTMPFVLLLAPIPKSSVFADKLLRAAYTAKYKMSKADVIVNVIYGDGVVVPRAGYWNSERKRYETKNGEHVKMEGEHSPRHLYGRTKVVWTLSRTGEAMDPIQAYAVTQRKKGRWMSKTNEDGSTDILVGADPPDSEETTALDWDAVWDAFFQQINQEDLEKQYDLGRMEEMDDSSGRRALMYVIIFAAGIAFALAIVWFLTEMVGTGGGGGGGGGTFLGALRGFGTIAGVM